MSYGKVINGGVQMRKGVSKGVNDKLSARSKEDSRRQTVATAVANVYKIRTLSDQHTNNVSAGGKFQKPSVPKNV
jgi:hypothetical protein